LAAPQSDGIAQEPATALLIVDLDKHIGNARAWRDTFGEQLPDLEIRISPDAGNLADIEYLAFTHRDFNSCPEKVGWCEAGHTCFVELS
jgi:hypothetical protein